ncbi:MAG TPA: ABC transporter permease [Lachnospiraceae bacterium]|nr:ABC transporter permease [Lachnospiraceae bacterium]
MNLFRLALNNIRKKFGSYLIYLVSAIFAVTIFSIFCSMYFNPQFSQYRMGVGKMASLFKVSAVAVIIFSSIFIIYANKFFVKTRKKEIAIYSLLGMRKEEIGKMLFYENMMIGIIAIAGGLFLGTLLSKFFCMIMLHMMKQVPKVDSSIQLGAVLVTVVAFLIIFIINSLNAYAIIFRYKLIELLSASKEGEKLPRYSILGGILSILLIVGGYVYGLSIDFNQGGFKSLPASFAVICLVVTGTVLFFINFIPMVVVKLKKNTRFYFKSTNFISLSQIVYRIKANSVMFSIIAILSAITVTMISATFMLYKTFENLAVEYTPFTYLSRDVTEEQFDKVKDTVNEVGEVKLLSASRFTLIKATGQNPLYKRDLYSDKNPGEIMTDDIKPGDPFEAYILSSSAYQEIIKNQETPTGEFNNTATDFSMDLKDNECYFIDGNMDTNYCKKLSGDISLEVGGSTERYKIAGVSMHKYLGVLKFIRKTTIVLNDEMYQKYLQSTDKNGMVSYMGLMFDHPMQSKSTVDALDKFIPKSTDLGEMKLNNLNYYDINYMLYAQYGAYLFIGTFLGILFLLASGSIMYYKQIIEAQEEVSRYDILKKTGMKKSEIKRSISKQLAVVFGMPLLIGLLHSAFAMLTFNKMMLLVAEQISKAYTWEAMICLLYIVIYCFYYRLSVSSYMKIVWGKGR